jgi:hypothetical protein
MDKSCAPLLIGLIMSLRLLLSKKGWSAAALWTRECGLDGRVDAGRRVVVILHLGVRIILRLIFGVLLWASFGLMIGLGLLMAYGLIPGIRGGQASEIVGSGQIRFNGGRWSSGRSSLASPRSIWCCFGNWLIIARDLVFSDS